MRRFRVGSYCVCPRVRFRQAEISLWKCRGYGGEKQLTLCLDVKTKSKLHILERVVISVVFSGHFEGKKSTCFQLFPPLVLHIQIYSPIYIFFSLQADVFICNSKLIQCHGVSLTPSGKAREIKWMGNQSHRDTRLPLNSAVSWLGAATRAPSLVFSLAHPILHFTRFIPLVAEARLA